MITLLEIITLSEKTPPFDFMGYNLIRNCPFIPALQGYNSDNSAVHFLHCPFLIQEMIP